jgi:hypothetical protein
MPFFFIFIIFASPLSFDFSFADFSHILFQAITIFAARCLRFISMLTRRHAAAGHCHYAMPTPLFSLISCRHASIRLPDYFHAV